VDSWSLALTCAYENGPWRLDGLVRAGFDGYASTRLVDLPTGAYETSARWTGFSGALELGGGYDFTFGDAVLGPFASIGWQTIAQSAFSESGAGGLGLRVAPGAEHNLDTALGARVKKTFRAGGATIVPELSAAWTAQWIDAPRTMAASFEASPGSGFEAASSGGAYHAARLSLGVEARLGETITASGRVETELFRRGYASGAASLGLSVSF